MNYKKIISMLERAGAMRWVPTNTFLKMKYKRVVGRELNLDQPKSFNEKLQWLKVYYAKHPNPRYTLMADKVEGKKIITSIIGVTSKTDTGICLQRH